MARKLLTCICLLIAAPSSLFSTESQKYKLTVSLLNDSYRGAPQSIEMDQKDELHHIYDNDDFVIGFAFSGGGTGGMGSATILDMMDKELKIYDKRCKIMDILRKADAAGTSTGAIVATFAQNPDKMHPTKNREFIPSDLMDLYRDNSPATFCPHPRWACCCFTAPLVDTKLVETGKTYFGDLRMKEVPRLYIVTVDKKTGKPEILTSKTVPDDDDTVLEQIRKSIAIPCCFAPHKGKMDGGSCLCNNDPSRIAAQKLLAELRIKAKKNPGKILLISVGAGKYCHTNCQCISENNSGGLLNCCLDGTPSIITTGLLDPSQAEVAQLADDEKIGIEEHHFDFPVGPLSCPLSFMDCCLDNIRDNAEKAVAKDPNFSRVVKLLYRYWQEKIEPTL